MTLPLDNHVKAPFYSSKTFTHPQTISLNSYFLFDKDSTKLSSMQLCSSMSA